ncbi:MAG: CDP-glucose 4,6-dehydratase [Gallionella sp.]|nr:CDP-glucose 4,6-dehydratase [Gallionella sp.]
MKFNQFDGKKVLVTGHTGFKGSWLAAWLLRLGASVSGLSDRIPTSPAHFEAGKMTERMSHHIGDVRDLACVTRLIKDERPDFVFHLAAQPLVRRSYLDPHLTIETNVMGTANILEALRLAQHPCTAVIVTSDKSYDNVEQVWGYRENDALGGKDPYSASKGAAELIVKTYAHSYFSAANSPVKVAVGRAGNVIGGGDWAADRIVPDCIRALRNKQPIRLRNPGATRPWQHVLEPLAGYLLLATRLIDTPSAFSDAWNFGPPSSDVRTVHDVAERIVTRFGAGSIEIEAADSKQHEARLLQLNCDKAQQLLGWRSRWAFEQTMAATAGWYKDVLDGTPAVDVTRKQLRDFFRSFHD